MKRHNTITNPMVIGGILGVTASVYAMSRMNMGQRRRVFRAGRGVARFANRMMDRMDMHWF